MIAALPTIVHLGGDAIIEVHPANAHGPPCLRVDDGEGHVSIDITAATWRRLREVVDAAMEGER